MSSIAKTKSKAKSVVSMLPITNLHATYLTALYPLLLFLEKQSQKLGKDTPVVTFDQQLYIKAYEIVASKKMKVFLRLGGFHQLMSFLGSCGTLMEGSGMRTALESLYAPVTVGYMTGKAYSRAIREHFLSISSLLSIMMVEFYTNLEHDKRKKLENIFDPSINQNHEIPTKFVKWY